MGLADIFNWEVALIWHPIFFCFAMLQTTFDLGMLWLIINTFVFLLLLLAVYGPQEDEHSNRAMAWYFYALSIFTDILSLSVHGSHSQYNWAGVFVLVMAIFILIPKPIFAYFLLKSLQNDGFNVKQGFSMRKLVMMNGDGGDQYQELREEQEETVRMKQQMMTCAPDQVKPPKMPQAPRPKARAFFSDNIIAESLAHPYVIDINSDHVGEGSYPNNRTAFPKAAGTFDGIAVDANTRVIMWEQPNFQGKVLLDVTGPTIINNIKHKSYYSQFIAKDFKDPELQKNYPLHVRVWSETDMNPWTTGSVKIVAS